MIKHESSNLNHRRVIQMKDSYIDEWKQIGLYPYFYNTLSPFIIS